MTEQNEATSLATPIGDSAPVLVVVSRQDWFEVWNALATARRRGLALEPVLREEPAGGSLAGLGAGELGFIRHQLSNWVRSGSTAPESMVAAWEPLLDRLLTWQEDAVVTTTASGALALPPGDFALLDREDDTVSLLDGLLQVYDHPVVARFLQGILDRPDFAREATGRPSFRLAALWLGATFDTASVLPILGRLYRDAVAAIETLAADRRAVEGTYLEPAWKSWISHFALDVVPRRRRFEARATGARQASPAAPALVTVVVPAFRHRAFITAAVESALGQSAGELRVLVVDDASDDGTAEAAAAIADPRLEVIRNDRNLGLGATVARALTAIDTPYFAILNSDDLFHRDRIGRCLEALSARPEADLVATGVVPIDAEDRRCDYADSSPVFDGRLMHDWLRWYQDEASFDRVPASLFDRLLAGNFLLTSSNLFGRVEALRRTRDRWAGLEFSLDWQILLDAAAADRLIVLAEPLLGYRLHQSNTVWFGDDRRWRYYLETCQVAARVLEDRMSGAADPPPLALAEHARALAGPLAANTAVDGAGLALAARMESQRAERARAIELARDLGGELPALRRAAAALPGLQAARGRAEALAERVESLRSTIARLRVDPNQSETQLLKAELQRRDAEHDALAREHDALARERDALVAERSRAARARIERETALRRQHAASEEAQRAAHAEREARLERELQALAIERESLLGSDDYRLGRILLDRLRLRAPARAAERMLRSTQQRIGLARLTLDRALPRRQPLRAMAGICWSFPIYSQTFVYQELTQLARHGFAVRHAYSVLDRRDHLDSAFAGLWRAKRRLVVHRAVQTRDLDRYRRLMPDKVATLIAILARESGLSAGEVLAHETVREGFSFARMVEAWRPHYLHSYFFYDGSLRALVAAYLHGVPRGISCYADHQLRDFDLKLVPLHLRLCNVVVATSARIRRELLELAPGVDPDKIVIKPNAIDTRRFPVVERREPGPGEPFRLVCVSRIEPKKGLLELAEAVHALRVKGLAVELHLVGDAEASPGESERYGRRLREQLDRLGLWGAVHLEGRQNHDGVRRFLALSHLFVAPFVETESGDKDGIPTSLLEAMSTGIPVLATDAGSILEAVDPGVEGVVVAQRDVSALAASIEQLLLDPARRATLGASGAERVRRELDIEVCERRFHQRLDRVLAGPRPGSELYRAAVR